MGRVSTFYSKSAHLILTSAVSDFCGKTQFCSTNKVRRRVLGTKFCPRIVINSGHQLLKNNCQTCQSNLSFRP